jgi:hypothetical protein
MGRAGLLALASLAAAAAALTLAGGAAAAGECGRARCGMGACAESGDYAFGFACQCRPGWSRYHLGGMQFPFLPCVIPNCKKSPLSLSVSSRTRSRDRSATSPRHRERWRSKSTLARRQSPPGATRAGSRSWHGTLPFLFRRKLLLTRQQQQRPSGSKFPVTWLSRLTARNSFRRCRTWKKKRSLWHVSRGQK